MEVRAGKAGYFVYKLSIHLPVFSPASPSRSLWYLWLWIRSLCEILQESDFHLYCDPLMVHCGLQLYPLSVVHPYVFFHLLSLGDYWNFLCSSIFLLLEMYCSFLFLCNLMESQEVVKRNMCLMYHLELEEKHVYLKAPRWFWWWAKFGRPCSKLSFAPTFSLF